MKVLTEAQLRQYQEEGATHPIRVLSQERARAYLQALEDGERQYGTDFRQVLRTKAHLALKWVDELVHDPVVLDAVEDVIGSDIRLYNLSVWIKNAGDGSYVGWHQDSTYFPLEPAVQVTAWVALTDSVEDNGNVKYLPGSHKLGQLRHGQEIGKGSLLSRGQYVVEPLDTRNVKSINLQPGEMSLHHTRLVHYSEPNKSSRRRIGLGISYIPTSVRCTGTIRHTAGLVRGHDAYNYWDDEPRPRFDFDPLVKEARESAILRYNQARDEQVEIRTREFAAA